MNTRRLPTFYLFFKFCSQNLEKELEFKDYSELVQKIRDGEVTLLVLKAISKLKGQEKQSFLEDVKDMVSNSKLHDLNKNIVECGIEFSDAKDLAFLLHRPEDAIFRDLLYLEAERNNFMVKINEEGALIINFPYSVLKTYKLLINNFYLKKFKNNELQEELYKLYKIALEKLGDTTEEGLENYHIKLCVALSIMCIYISKYFKENKDNISEKLIKLDIFKKAGDSEKFKALKNLSSNDQASEKLFILTVVDDVLNNREGVYIKHLVDSNLLEEIMYCDSFSNMIVKIEISGDCDTII